MGLLIFCLLPMGQALGGVETGPAGDGGLAGLPAPPPEGGVLAADAPMPESRSLPVSMRDDGPRTPEDIRIEPPRDPLAADSMRQEPGTPWRLVAGADNDHGSAFRCPVGNEDNAPAASDTNVQVIRTSCPFRIIDDADLLGSPQLAVRHDDPDEVAFFSLHGAATGDGPTPRSREPEPELAAGQGTPGGLSHTTFTSRDGGWNWEDNPHGREGFGETASGVMNRDGNLVMAFLFSKFLGTDRHGDEIFDYHFALYKDNTVQSRPSYKATKFPTREPGNTIQEVNLVLVKPQSLIRTQDEYDEVVREHEREKREAAYNGSQPPSREDEIGNYTIPRDEEDYSDDIIAAVWHERAYDWRNATTGRSSWVSAAWTDASSRDDWHVLPDEQLIGPCREASDPASWNGLIYVACSVDAGYTGRRGAQIGDVDIWAIDPVSERKMFIGHAGGVGDGQLRLAANEEGRMVLTSTKPVGQEAPYEFVRVHVAWSWYGRDWDSVYDIGGQLHNIWGQPVIDARVTSLALTTEEQTMFLSYMERSDMEARQPDGLVDPNPAEPRVNAAEFHKAVGVYEYCNSRPVLLWDLQVGVRRHPFQEGLVNDFTGVFDDLHDGTAIARDAGTGREHIYFAYGDHGVIQYGILDSQDTSLQGMDCNPIPQAPVFFTPAPAAPAPLLVSQGVNAALAASMGAPTALGLGYLLIAKRRAAMAAAVKAK